MLGTGPCAPDSCAGGGEASSKKIACSACGHILGPPAICVGINIRIYRGARAAEGAAAVAVEAAMRVAQRYPRQTLEIPTLDNSLPRLDRSASLTVSGLYSLKSLSRSSYSLATSMFMYLISRPVNSFQVCHRNAKQTKHKRRRFSSTKSQELYQYATHTLVEMHKN